MNFDGNYNNAPAAFNQLFDHVCDLAPYNTFAELSYHGLAAGTEFLTYNASKMYICCELVASLYGNPTPAGVNVFVTLYNEADILHLAGYDSIIFWDATAGNYRHSDNKTTFKNIYFSRLALGSYTYLKFIGIRATIV